MGTIAIFLGRRLASGMSLLFGVWVVGGCSGTDVSEPADGKLRRVESAEVDALESSAGSDDDAALPALVRIDGALYSSKDAAEAFGDSALHWIAQGELDEDIPTAFTSEARRNDFLGIDARVPSGHRLLAKTVYADLYEHTNGTGARVSITGPANNLGHQGFNDKASAVDTYSTDIILYEHINQNKGNSGCSLHVQKQKQIQLNKHWCRFPSRTWNDLTSSVGVVR